jgi:hypothetical protein
MAEPAGQGQVEQKNIDAMAAPLINEYHESREYELNQNSGSANKSFKTKIDESNPSW